MCADYGIMEYYNRLSRKIKRLEKRLDRTNQRYLNAVIKSDKLSRLRDELTLEIAMLEKEAGW